MRRTKRRGDDENKKENLSEAQREIEQVNQELNPPFVRAADEE